MKTIQQNPSHFLILIFVVAFFSCNTSSDTGNDSIDVDTASVDTIATTIKEIYIHTPSPTEIMSIIKAGGLTFVPNITNPTEKIDQYPDLKSQAQNFGIYLTDLGYCTLFNNYGESSRYLGAIRILNKEIKLTGAFEKKLAKRIEKHLRNPDSLYLITNEAYYNIVDFAIDNNREKELCLIITGAYFECLYIALKSITDFSDNEELMRSIADQRFVLEEIQAFVSHYKNDPLIRETYNDLSEIQTIFQNLTIEKNDTEVAIQDSIIKITGGDKVKINETVLKELKGKIIEIRTKITK